MEMMKMRTKTTGLSRMNGEEGKWEMRPGGMVVQKRTGSELDYGATVTPLIQVRVKFGSIYHQVNISSQTTFGAAKQSYANILLNHRATPFTSKAKPSTNNIQAKQHPKTFDILLNDPSLTKNVPILKPMVKNGISTFQITDEIDDILAEPLKLALIGKFPYKRHFLNVIRRFMSNLKQKAQVKYTLIDDIHIMMLCVDAEDYARIWSKQRWYLGNDVMNVFKWTPCFQPDKESPIVIGWITLPTPRAYHVTNPVIMFAFAKEAGTPIRIDESTFTSSIPLARVQNEYDVILPRPKCFWVEHRKGRYFQKIVYKEVPRFCLTCSLFGHTDDTYGVAHPDPRKVEGSPPLTHASDRVSDRVMDSTSESGSRSERQGLSGELVVDLDGITIDELARAPRNVACQGVVISQTFAVLDHEIGGEEVVSSAKRHPHLGQVSPVRTRALTRSLSRVFVSRSPERESGASPRHYLTASDEDGISEHGSDVDRLYHLGSENCLRDDQVSRGVQITGDILEDDSFRPAREQSRPGRGSTCFTFSRPSHLPPSTSTTVKGKARRSLSQTRYSLRGKTSGELKKMLSGPTGLHHEDQKLLFKDKERDSKTFLDIVGVKNKSKIVLIEDPISQEKRHIEMRKKAKQEKALKSISEISLEVDRLAGKVSMLESIMSKGGKVVEKDLLSLTEHLMNQLLNLDGIIGDGDVKLQREMQVKRVQKYVESLDMLKLKNSTSTSNGTKIPKQHTPIQQQQTPPPKYSNGHISSLNQYQQPHNFTGSLQNQTRAKQDHSSNHSPSTSVVITTQWETFDVGPSIVYAAPKFNWDLL